MERGTVTACALPATAASLRSRRLADIDFWRGFVLCCILVNHIPDNVFERFTPKNYGFSDSAEAFVFLSGLSLTPAYGRRFAEGGASEALQRLRIRVVKLYGIHLFLSVAAIAVFAAGAMLGGDDDLMNVHGRALFVDDPTAALLGLVSLGHQLGYFNILPLYMVLIGIFVAQIALARVAGPWPMLLASASVYGIVRLTGLDIPTWPMKGSWFFNPLAWQLLIALGVAAAMLHGRCGLIRTRALLLLSGLVVVAGVVSVTDGFSRVPGLYDWTRGWADLDKTSLGLGRLIHFAAVAYLLFSLGIAAWLRGTRVYEPLCLLGRNSLAVFAVLSLLAAVGQVVEDLVAPSPVLDGLMVAGGLAILYGVARASEAWPGSIAGPWARLRPEHR